VPHTPETIGLLVLRRSALHIALRFSSWIDLRFEGALAFLFPMRIFRLRGPWTASPNVSPGPCCCGRARVFSPFSQFFPWALTHKKA